MSAPQNGSPCLGARKIPLHCNAKLFPHPLLDGLYLSELDFAPNAVANAFSNDLRTAAAYTVSKDYSRERAQHVAGLLMLGVTINLIRQGALPLDWCWNFARINARQQSDGQVVLPITGAACRLEVTLPEAISV